MRLSPKTKYLSSGPFAYFSISLSATSVNVSVTVGTEEDTEIKDNERVRSK